ncbi:MAG: hypothetical protein AB7L94_43330 [Kofleriaceae bacterium]
MDSRCFTTDKVIAAVEKTSLGLVCQIAFAKDGSVTPMTFFPASDGDLAALTCNGPASDEGMLDECAKILKAWKNE